MIPDIQIFAAVISVYQIMALVGVFVVGLYIIRAARRHGFDENLAIQVFLFAGIGVVLGGHIVYAITNYELVIYTMENLHEIDSLSAFFSRIYLIFGGSVFYGGLFGGLLASHIALKKTAKLDRRLFMRHAVPAIPLFHGIARIGCLLSGCCYGVECTPGIVYQYSRITDANGVSRFPVQAVEAILNIVLFLVLLKLGKNSKTRDALLQIYLVSYAIMRFSLEFLRGDALRGVYFGISTSQIISIITIVVIAILTLKEKHDKKLIA